MFRLENKTDKSAKRDLFITVAGNVGAGKSTLTKLVGEKLDFETHFEKVDGNPYLEDFYRSFRIKFYGKFQNICRSPPVTTTKTYR